ncbi:response regulator transcription factor [Peribacillus frigoritolerans]|uniref:response regulator transcription factor n=1 Tax=Peribacillus frigoritolerans TaxID=450367 RepID=UPI000BACEAE7|nr:response regulator transcription factor [Peribacillus frigoritolerans]MED3708917.1 response regulator transcription factor [Peribacillus frigoritolerans]MED3888494.1 response regulator transcription factor [Peribacillus frigoritolerans]PAW30842.1 hypothetical protein BKC07_00340 [Peribacillus simplex]
MKSIKLMIYGGQGGIEGIIEQEGDIKVMGMTGNEMDLLDSDHTSVIPDVILIDARSSGKYGQEVMQVLKEKHPSTPFVVFTDYSENHYLIEAIGHGAAVMCYRMAEWNKCCRQSVNVPTVRSFILPHSNQF